MLSGYFKDPHNNYIQALLLLQCTRVHWHAAQNKFRMTNTSARQHTDLTSPLGYSKFNMASSTSVRLSPMGGMRHVGLPVALLAQSVPRASKNSLVAALMTHGWDAGSSGRRLAARYSIMWVSRVTLRILLLLACCRQSVQCQGPQQ